MLRRIVLLAVLACGLVAAPAFSLRPYRPDPVDFESGAGAQKRFGRAVQSQPIETGRRFNLVGMRWRGGAEPRIGIRTRREGGGWSRWTTLPAQSEDAPDPGRGEPDARGTSTPAWVGEADYVQYRLSKPVPGLKLHYVNVKGSSTGGDRLRSGLRRVADHVAALIPGTPAAKAAEARPGMVSRAGWGASDCPPRSGPEYGSVKAAYVHHTVSTNDYTRSEAPSVVLGICRFHRNSNGWNDIGYNFLVDKYGVLYEGRAGGVDRAVIGAQAQGYNSQTTGIANIGTFTSVPQSSAALDAMARLIRWKLPLHGAPTAGSTTVTSAGGDTNRYAAGRSVRLNRVAGHRDTNLTECPGSALYGQLGDLRARVGGLSGGAGTRLTAKLTPRTATYKRPVKVSGRLTKFDGSPVTGTRVGVQARTTGGRYRTVAKVPLDADGNYETVVRPRGTRYVRVRFGGGGGLAGTYSRRTTLKVKPLLRLRGLPEEAAPKELISVRGSVAPRKRRVFAVLQARRGERFRTTSTRALQTSRRGRFSLRFRPAKAGEMRVYFVVRADRNTARLTTRRRLIDVR
jgi:hypothetical protein